ncbi:MAG: hypothetical protein ROZ36_15595 [Thermincola sp.]|jgi:hypothetical protein|nr:hypothetical protein [Thermincola sp.]
MITFGAELPFGRDNAAKAWLLVLDSTKTARKMAAKALFTSGTVDFLQLCVIGIGLPIKPPEILMVSEREFHGLLYHRGGEVGKLK